MNMNKTNYKIFDLFIFTLIASAVEGINVYAFSALKIHVNGYSFNQLFTLSFACVMGVIAIFRWNAFGLVVAPIAGITSVSVRLLLNQSVTVNLWLAYSLGYLGLAVCLLFFYKRNKKELRQDKPKMIVYYLTGYLAVEVCRALCQIGSENYWSLLWNYVCFDLLNIIFGGIVFFIALRQDSLVVDMNTYLVELHDFQAKLGGQDIVSKNVNISVEELSEANEINEAAILDGGTLSNDDLRKMEAFRRKFENRESKYDKENEMLEDYRKNKEAKHGS